MPTKPAPVYPTRTGNNRGLTQAYDLRDLAASEAMALRDVSAVTLEEKLDRANAIKALALVWKDASDRIRILRGRPLPGSKRPAAEPHKPRTKPLTGPTEA